MDDTGITQLSLHISAADATDEEIDRLTRQLLSELRELDVESAKLSGGEPAPAGSKGDASALSSIVVDLLPTAIPAVVTLVQAWMARGQGRTVKFKGKGIEFEGTPEEFQKLMTTLEKAKKKK